MTEDETTALLAYLKAAFSTFEVTDAVIRVWQVSMNRPTPIPFAAAEFAVMEYIPVATWPPKPVDIRAIVEEKVCGLPSVDAAWRQVERSMRENYPGHPVRYTPDPLVLDAARVIGGIHMLRNAPSDRDYERLRERFRFAYEELRRARAEIADIDAAWHALSAGERPALRALERGDAA